MPTNIEIKARVKNLELLLEKARSISGSQGTRLEQEDVFFNSPNGRLKLRIENEGASGKLIYYTRNDISGPKQSDYTYTIVQNPKDLKETLRLALGVRGIVKKVRQLFMVGQTRVHVDSVEGLGNFMELEVCMRKGQEMSEGTAIAEELMKDLGISDSDLVVCAYMDLLDAKNNKN
ncbi:PREDICTED: uncharacterized protein LOC100631935 [Amphimedon queenslandica]|uniref:CYTH domain-containing protein n=1 Tax=Amphimedon queenslandica TaxID=400682 RepID=A0A1X7VUP4_AMPQE|nr:PREDICTED: uncharacterized protein LOC100631935 [Amphimedon queenslandica]|eukprot:XP_003382753.1 PREDICTED: uncharacterized protein LOC100631935 [Amphimedon queenslandica]